MNYPSMTGAGFILASILFDNDMTKKTEYYARDGHFILCNDGTPWKAKGKGIYQTALLAMVNNDYALLGECKRLLMMRRRWPRRMDNPDGIDYMNPKQMFRSDYVAFYMACIEMEREHWIKQVKPPFYLYSISFDAWRRFLINMKSHQKRRYEFWSWVDFIVSPKRSVKDIFNLALMAWTARSESAMNLQGAQLPDWNLCGRQLTKHPLARREWNKIESFAPGMGFVWHWETSDPWHKSRILLPLFQEYYLDWDLAVYIYERNFGKQ